MAIGIYVSGSIGVWYLRRVDWNYESRKTLKRLSTFIRPRETSDPNEGSEVFKGHYFATICNELSN